MNISAMNANTINSKQVNFQAKFKLNRTLKDAIAYSSDKTLAEFANALSNIGKIKDSTTINLVESSVLGLRKVFVVYKNDKGQCYDHLLSRYSKSKNSKTNINDFDSKSKLLSYVLKSLSNKYKIKKPEFIDQRSRSLFKITKELLK